MGTNLTIVTCVFIALGVALVSIWICIQISNDDRPVSPMASVTEPDTTRPWEVKGPIGKIRLRWTFWRLTAGVARQLRQERDPEEWNLDRIRGMQRH